MTDKEIMRAQFEAAFTAHCESTGFVARLERFADGRYEYVDTASAWWAWQASREAVVVVLPDPMDGRYCSSVGFDEILYCVDATDAIEVHGLKVKQ